LAVGTKLRALAELRDLIPIEIVALVDESERAALEAALAVSVNGWEDVWPDALVTTIVARVEDQSRRKYEQWMKSFEDDAAARRRAED
jgi:hypothetical protein